MEDATGSQKLTKADDALIDQMFNPDVPMFQKKARFAFVELLQTGNGIMKRNGKKYRKAAFISSCVGLMIFAAGVILSFLSDETLSLPFLIGGPTLIVTTVLGHLWHIYCEGVEDRRTSVFNENILSQQITGLYFPDSASLFESSQEQNNMSVGESVCAAIKRWCPCFFSSNGVGEYQKQLEMYETTVHSGGDQTLNGK